MRVLLLGGTGQVGREVARLLQGSAEVFAPGREVADLARPERLEAVVREIAPTVVVNAAAWTAVDRAESEREGAFLANSHAPAALARGAREVGALLVHYSTDYVFDGNSTTPWREDAPTSPLNVYGASKLEGEERIAASGARHAILRTSWVYAPRGNNFLLTMRRLFHERSEVRVVSDQVGVPTSARYVARATLRVIERWRSAVPLMRPSAAAPLRPSAPEPEEGIFHVAAAGEVSWHHFATAIHQRLLSRGPLTTTRVVPITSAEFPTPARRPRYSVLDPSKFASVYGMEAPGWEGLLDEVIGEMDVPIVRGSGE